MGWPAKLIAIPLIETWDFNYPFKLTHTARGSHTFSKKKKKKMKHLMLDKCAQ